MQTLLLQALLMLGMALGSGSVPAGTPKIAAGLQHSLAIDSSGRLFAWGDDSFGQLGLGRTLETATPRRADAAGPFVRVAAGGSHSLALKADGSLWAWGKNNFGQVGDGTRTTRDAPVPIGNGFVRIAAGTLHSLALKADGGLWGWGWIMPGGSDPTPHQILTGVTAMAGGYRHVLVIKADGSLWAWGINEGGEVGDGTTVERSSPVPIGSGFTAVAAGLGHSVALKADGSLWAWGRIAGATTPRQIGSGFVAIAAGESHALALKFDGSAWAWGSNSHGQLGDGATFGSQAPVQVGTGFVAVSAGNYQSVAIRTDGSLWAWGSSFPFGYDVLGTGTRRHPVPMGGGNGFTALAAGGFHVLALKADGTLWTWGSNVHGELALGEPIKRLSPTTVGAGFTAVAAGYQHSLALKADGSLWAWGLNATGQVGDGTYAHRSTPVQVGTGFVAVSAGWYHSLALKVDGSLWSWGSNVYGQLGDGTTGSRLTPAQIGTGFAAIAAGDTFNVALRTDGSLWTWGSSFAGELGDGTATSGTIISQRAAPAQIGTGFTAIAAADAHGLALKPDGSLWAWGKNVYGQLGDGTTTNRLVPTQIATGFVAIDAGWGRSYALKADGSLWGWGTNGSVALGDGLDRNETCEFGHRCVRTPKAIGSGFVATAAGDSHTLAFKADGSLWSWGTNWWGQLGTGTVAYSTVPINVANEAVTDNFDLTPDSPIDPANALLPYFLATRAESSDLLAILTDLRAAGRQGEVYFSALLPAGSPLLGCSGGCTAGTAASTPRRALVGPTKGPLNRMARSGRLDGGGYGGGMVAGVLARGGFKQTGGAGYAQADAAYTGDLERSGTLEVYRGVAKDPLDNSGALICMGVTVPELSVKGQVLMRPIATGTAVQGVVQCPPVQTAATIARFRSEASGPLTARTIVAQLNPLDEDRGKTLKVFSWAVAPDGRRFMQTGPNKWEAMTEPMRPAATITVPASGAYRLEITRNLDLSGLEGTLVLIGLGQSWEEVRNLNKAGHHHTVQ